MGWLKTSAAVLTAGAMIVALPAPAAAADQAERLHRLEIMLMVTSLGCRHTNSDFQGDYERFTANHQSELTAASVALKADLTARSGAVGADRALDKISVRIANEFGAGHPWLSCGQLRQVTRGLAQARGPEPLVAAAQQLLEPSGPEQFALAGH